MKKTIFFILGGLISMVSAPATADINIKPYIVFGLSYDHAILYDELGKEVTYLTGYDIETSDLINTNHFGVNLNFGVQFNKYFATEVFYQHTFNSKATIEFIDGELVSKVSSNNFGADLMGMLPITDTNFSLIGSIGLGSYKFSVKETIAEYGGFESNYSESESNMGFRIGIGGQYAFSDNWAARFIIRYVGMNSDKKEDVVDGLVDISLGIKYSF
jgi:opacity protein-like surface antigen